MVGRGGGVAVPPEVSARYNYMGCQRFVRTKVYSFRISALSKSCHEQGPSLPMKGGPFKAWRAVRCSS